MADFQENEPCPTEEWEAMLVIVLLNDRSRMVMSYLYTVSDIETKKTKTYNRRDSQMVTHSSTSRPVQCLCMAERTGCPVLTDLWSYVQRAHKNK